MMGTSPQTSASEVMSVLLDLHPELGCCEAAVRRVRSDRDLRRMVAERMYQPTLERFDVDVDYDHSANRRLTPDTFRDIHPSISTDDFAVTSTGRRTIEMVEIFPHCTLTTNQHFRLLRMLGYRSPCLAETWAALRSVLRRRSYPLLSYCGSASIEDEAVVRAPAFLRMPTGLILSVAKRTTRWSDHRILAVAEA